jgi:hypothetical protein
MPTISMFSGIIIRVYFAPASTIRRTSMFTTMNSQRPLTSARVRFLRASCPAARGNWCLRGQSCTEKNYWPTGIW